MVSNDSTCQEIQQDDKKQEIETLSNDILSLVEKHLSFLPDDGSSFRDRYYLSKFFDVVKDITIKIGKKLKSKPSYMEIRKIATGIIESITWDDIHKNSDTQESIDQLQQACNNNSQQIIVLSFESARTLLLQRGEPDNEETAKKAIEMVRKKFPNVPIQYQQEIQAIKENEEPIETPMQEI